MFTLSPKLSRFLICMLVGLAVGTAINEISFYFMGSGSTRPATTIEITIPAGTQAKIDQKVAVNILPQTQTFVLGDELIIKNQDQVDHQFGALFIPSGSSATIVFNQANSFTYECSFENKKVFGFEVLEPLTTSTRAYGIFIAGIPLGVMLFIYSIASHPFAEKSEKNEA